MRAASGNCPKSSIRRATSSKTGDLQSARSLGCDHAQAYKPAGIIGAPLTAQTDPEIFIMAGMILLAPGTLSVDFSEDRKMLFVHVMFLGDMLDYLTGILMRR
jgi:hypothetical protein